jgi:hypothetical protein
MRTFLLFALSMRRRVGCRDDPATFRSRICLQDFGNLAKCGCAFYQGCHRKSTNMTRQMLILWVLLLLAYRLDLAAGQVANNPLCYVCGNGSVSTITKPNVIIALPTFVGHCVRLFYW